MTTTIRLTFSAGRYHATPWGHHVNEGLVEWPPSPWRIVRAILAVGFSKHGWMGPGALPVEAATLFHTLADHLPAYRLPRGGVAHTRHYLPVTEGKIQKTTKVLDTFLRFGDGDSDEQALFITWPITLPVEARDLLAQLVNGLPYLGRAEAWVDAQLMTTTPPDDQWTSPVIEGELIEPGWEQVLVLAPIAKAVYSAWRISKVTMDNESKAIKSRKNTADDLYPADLLACLCTDTATLQKQGWSQPPGSRQVLYRRPMGCMEPAVPTPKRTSSRRESVTCALLALSADTATGTLLPLMSRCLPQAEHLHAAWVKKLGEHVHNPTVSGRSVDGSPMLGHQHAHLIPLDLDGNGRMDHVLVWAPGMMNQEAQQALQRLSRTWGKDVPEIVVTCAGMGSLAQVVGQLRDRRDRLPAVLGLSPGGRGTVWTSATPFIAPRFIKAHGTNTWDGQVRAECRSRGLPEPIQVKDLGRDVLIERNFMRFIRARSAGHQQPQLTIPWCLELTFAEPIAGPLCLGYGSHFGLGLFAAQA